LTTRQHEIISLAVRGLSIRSVEGHFFRASQRVGANSREQLIAILQES
jgi:DNA-binding CsgD family transcriptional regulator